jgi:hypothetical protein
MFGSDPRTKWLNAWMETNRLRHLFKGLLLVCNDLFSYGSRSQTTENRILGRALLRDEQCSQDRIVHSEELCMARRSKIRDDIYPKRDTGEAASPNAHRRCFHRFLLGAGVAPVRRTWQYSEHRCLNSRPLSVTSAQLITILFPSCTPPCASLHLPLSLLPRTRWLLLRPLVLSGRSPSCP